MIFYMDRIYNDVDLINGIAPDFFNNNILAVALLLVAIIISTLGRSTLIKTIAVAFALCISLFIVIQEYSSSTEREYFVLNEPSKIVEVMDYSEADKVYLTSKENTSMELDEKTIIINPYDYGAKPYKSGLQSDKEFDEKVMKWIVSSSAIILIISLAIGALIPERKGDVE